MADYMERIAERCMDVATVRRRMAQAASYGDEHAMASLAREEEAAQQRLREEMGAFMRSGKLRYWLEFWGVA